MNTGTNLKTLTGYACAAAAALLDAEIRYQAAQHYSQLPQGVEDVYTVACG